MKKPICITCEHFASFPDSDHALDGGECHINPPVAFSNGTSAWPLVLYGDWCGEHRVGRHIDQGEAK